MLNTVIILALIIASLIIMVSVLFFRRGRRSSVYQIPSLATPAFKKMIESDFQTITQYLNHSASKNLHSPSQAAWQIRKNATVATICNAITRFNLRQEQGQGWRYFIDTIEVQLPSQLEPFLQRQNVMEIVETDHLPLIVALNSHSLKEFSYEWEVPSEEPRPQPEADIHEGEPNTIQLLKMRKESKEEHRLHNSSGWLGAIVVSLSFFIGYLTIVSIPIFQGWGLTLAAAVFILGMFLLFRLRLFPKPYQDVQCIYGQAKRWELYGELDKKYSSTISIGGVDLHYPSYWLPYLKYELNHPTNIDLYSTGEVLRYGRYLSVHEEERYYPYKRFKKNVLMFFSALLVLAMVFSYQSISLPVKLGFAWIEGAKKVSVVDPSDLTARKIRVGDTLSAKGIGMCYRPPNLNDANQALFVPFDCSGVYWNNINLITEPQSEIVNRAIDLLNSVKNQLHPDKDAAGINPRLQREIMKSGMNIIFDFSEIILKTNALCDQQDHCIKLKSALSNLGGSADDWPSLVNKASSGKLSGAHVLLRAGSADALENLVEDTTYDFIKKELEKEVRKLNSPPPGGVLLISDENRPLVDLMPVSSLSEMNQVQRWYELKRLSSILINTPFDVEGVITNISTDANGTLQVVVHERLDEDVLSEYVCRSMLVFFLIICTLINGTLIIIRVLNNKRRLRKITEYYDKCYEADNPSESR
ncbi:IgaA/UmoB family intracellular growth attenuator [Providencia alcalifaciens]|uniref:IgaA/UmoB family intracellular growth attenuator n=1 Tax=Providencia alcalifaciens TaxID=126385 RepID=UPI001CC4C2B8|nr:IgaA/UmoB family intracellular growth attenuator [Providencia alcalifaciens]CAG9406504.1 Intracellular growth attenuator protein igaA [Providencia alcalifaciens]